MRGYAKFLIKRAIFLAVTLLVATYVTVIIATAGGYIDQILRSQIEFDVSSSLARDPAFKALPKEIQEEIRKSMIEQRIKAAGLDKPFPQRSLTYLIQALSLNLGRAMTLRSSGGSSAVRDIIFERLPWSVLLFTSGTIISALIGIFLGLHMARRALGSFDRLMTMFAIITNCIPSWFFGIFLIIVFAFYLPIFPYGGLVGSIHENPLSFILDVLYHLALPLTAWILATVGGWAYITRNIVVGTFQEDFVTMARAKGVPEKTILYKHVLRPSSPPIVTMLVLAVIISWTGAIVTEIVFGWPGLGSLYWDALMTMDAPVIIGLTVMYGYLFVITIFVLDIIYAILDPRVRTLGKIS